VPFTLILTTSATLKEAKIIARKLVEAKAAACVNISRPVNSIYRWNGKIEKAKEVMLFIKTTSRSVRRVKKIILAEHSYQVPEIICLPIWQGHQPYMDWIKDAVC